MPQEFLGVASRNCFPTVDVESTNLGLGCQRHDCLDDLGNSEDRTIVMGVRRVTGHEEMSSCLAVSIGLREVGCITVCCEDHVTCLVGHNGIGVCGRIVQELLDLDHCVLGGIRLLGGNGSQSIKHCAVNASFIVENVPTTSWTYFLSSLERGGDMSMVSTHCLVALYAGLA